MDPIILMGAHMDNAMVLFRVDRKSGKDACCI
jgi:hypothetical protein